MAAHSSIAAGESRGQRSLAGYGPYGHRVGHDCRDFTQDMSVFSFMVFWL